MFDSSWTVILFLKVLKTLHTKGTISVMKVITVNSSCWAQAYAI